MMIVWITQSVHYSALANRMISVSYMALFALSCKICGFSTGQLNIRFKVPHGWTGQNSESSKKPTQKYSRDLDITTFRVYSKEQGITKNTGFDLGKALIWITLPSEVIRNRISHSEGRA